MHFLIFLFVLFVVGFLIDTIFVIKTLFILIHVPI